MMHSVFAGRSFASSAARRAAVSSIVRPVASSSGVEAPGLYSSPSAGQSFRSMPSSHFAKRLLSKKIAVRLASPSSFFCSSMNALKPPIASSRIDCMLPLASNRIVMSVLSWFMSFSSRSRIRARGTCRPSAAATS